MITLIVGLLTILLGILFIAVPEFSRMGNEWLLGVVLVAGAIMNFGFAVTTLRSDVRIYTLLLGLVTLITGVTILTNPLDRAITLTTLLGLFFIAESGLMGGLGASLRPNWTVSGLVFAVAFIAFVMSLLIWVRLAGAPKQVIITLLGIIFLARGIVYVVISHLVKTRGRLASNDHGHGQPTESSQSSYAETASGAK